MTADQRKDLTNRKEALKEYLDIDKKLIEIEELEEKTTTPDFWEDPKKAELVLKEIKGLKFWTDNFQNVTTSCDDVDTLQEFYELGEGSENDVNEAYNTAITSLEELEYKRMLSNEEDQLNAVLEINPGAGGTESNDWASMLMRMYIMWGEKNGFKVKEVNLQSGEVAGIKAVTLAISMDG